MHAILAALALAAAGSDPSPSRVDRLGDPLPAGARFRIGTNRLQLGQHIHALAVSADGKLLAGAGHDRLALWDAATGRAVRHLSGRGSANAHVCAFTADGQAVAVNTLRELVLVDTITGNIRATLGTTASHCAIASDGRTLTAVQWDGDATAPAIRAWDLTTAMLRHSWKYRPTPTGAGGGQPAVRFCLSPDGRTFGAVEVQPDRTTQIMRVHEAATGKELHRWQTKDAIPAACSLSPDGKLLATGTEQATIRVWDVATGKELRRWDVPMVPSPGADYAETAFAPDGATLFCQTPAGLVRRDWRTGATLRTYPNTAGVPVFVSGGKVMAVRGAGFTVRLLDIATGADQCPLSRAGSHFAFGPAGRLIASTEGGAVVLTDAVRGTEVRRWDAATDGPLAFAPDGKSIAALSRDHRIRCWDSATGRAARTLEPTHPVTRLAFAHDGRQLTASYGAAASLWDVRSAKLLGHWAADAVTLAPDLRMVASGDRKHHHIRLTDAASGKPLHTLAGYRDWVRYGYRRPGGGEVGAAAFIQPRFSPDARLLLAGGEALKPSGSDAVYLWDTASGRRVFALAGDKFILNNIAFAPDGRMLTLMRSDGWIILVNAALGTVVRSLGQGKDHMAVTPVFTPDGHIVVTVVGDVIQFWEVATGGEICRRSGHSGDIHTLTMAPDGRTMATSAFDQTILVWDLEHLVESMPPVDALWTELASRNAARGRAAMQALVAAPAQALPLLRERLAPQQPPDAKQLARWIADLDSDDFDTREQAEAQLDHHRESAALPLQQALSKNPSLEARRRIEGLLRKADLGMISPDDLRRLRAVQVLELIGTPEARTLAQTLTGTPQR